jgi:proteasome lid subunit RPN8/RPN11
LSRIGSPDIERYYEVYILAETLEAIMDQCKSQVPYEAIGFLVGKDYRWLDSKWIFIDGFISGKTRATQMRVEFDEGVMGGIVAELRQKYTGRILVGWYHSHPGYGCFMSSTDLDTQRSCFREPYHVALVVDPLQEFIEFFKIQSDGKSYRPVSFASIR